MTPNTTKLSAQPWLAGLKRTGLLASLAASLTLIPTLRATLLWQADTTRGTSVFENLDIGETGGTITVAADPLGRFGNVYKYYLPDEPSGFGKERTESKGSVTPSGNFQLSNDTDYYIGWRSMWNPMPSNPGWVALFQIHGYGPSGQPAPLVLRCLGDGNISLQNGVTGGSDDFWHVPLQLDVWQAFVIHVNISADPAVGYVEVWYNGVQQTLQGGVTRLYCQTVDATSGSFDAVKWGVYRSGAMDGTGPATAYMSDAKIGTTYADVNPMPPVADPSFLPAGGTYTGAQSISITTTTSGASIRYTTDGSTPSETAGTLYTGPVTVSVSETLKAIAYKTGMSDSGVKSATYTINAGTTTPLNDTASGITYTGTWSHSANRGLGEYQNDVHYTKTNGDSVSYTFNGTGIDYVTDTYSDEGHVSFYIDGVLKATVSCVSSTRAVQQAVFSATGLASGSHTLKAVKVDGTFMLLDELIVHN